MTMEELNTQGTVDIVLGEDAGKDGVHDRGGIALFELDIGIVERGERVER